MASKSTQSAAPAKKRRKPAPQPAKSPRPSARSEAPSSQRIAVSGSQSGLGLAIRQRLQAADGWRVIGIDLPGKGAEVEADLSSSAGRAKAVAGVLKQLWRCAAGCGGQCGHRFQRGELTFQVNFFGVTELLEGLRPALARAERAGGRGDRVACDRHFVPASRDKAARRCSAAI
jgi:hypothetical protein